VLLTEANYFRSAASQIFVQIGTYVSILLRKSHGSVDKVLDFHPLNRSLSSAVVESCCCIRESLVASGRASGQTCSRASETLYLTRGYVRTFVTMDWPVSQSVPFYTNVQVRIIYRRHILADIQHF